MRPLSYDIFSNEPLPPQDEWQLSPFTHRSKSIDIVELLSIGADEGQSSGGDAHVFKILVDGVGKYALKVFKFRSIPQLRASEYSHANKTIDDAEILYQTDPFFAECRAYGRIAWADQELAQRSKAKEAPRVAVPCHGYLGLRFDVYEEALLKKFGKLDWGDLPKHLRGPKHKRPPFRALVKDLIEEKKAVFNPRIMLRDLKLLRKYEVYQRDVYPRNYLGGRAVDFSIAWTKPHWVFDVVSPPAIEQVQEADLVDWNLMIKAVYPNSRSRAIKDFRATYKLRSSGPVYVSDSSESTP